MGSKILDALMITLPLSKKIFNMDVQLGLLDREKSLGVWKGESISMDTPVGEYLDRNNIAHKSLLEVMESGKPKIDFLPEQVYGVPVEGILTPIYEDGQVVGIVSCAISVKNRLKLKESALNLNNSLDNAQDNINEVSVGATNLSDNLNSIKEISDVVNDIVTKTTSVVKTIESNSQRSNILALNASIEAARAGDAGKGFSVVASEMGTLAKVSGESTKSISEKLGNIFNRIDDIMGEIDAIAEVAKGQVDSVENMTCSIDSIRDEALKLKKAINID